MCVILAINQKRNIIIYFNCLFYVYYDLCQLPFGWMNHQAQFDRRLLDQIMNNYDSQLHSTVSFD